MQKEKLIESMYIEEYDDKDDNELVVLYSNGEVDSLWNINDIVDIYGKQWDPWVDGIDGVDWKDGIDWVDGKDGKDWSPDTAPQIVSKLESLKWKERLSAKAIKWLEEYMGSWPQAGASRLDMLQDVYIRNIQAWQILAWDTDRQQFINTGDIVWTGTVTNIATTWPIIGWPITTTGTIGITQATTSTDGYLSRTDRNTFNNKQNAISLTTTGSSGAATFVANVLNIPDYGSALSGYVPYTGATANVNIGHFTYIGDSLRANDTAGVLIESANGTDIGLLGAANTANVVWYGAHNYSAATQDTIAAFVGAGKTLSSLSTATYPSLTELSYIKGVTSPIQTQINALVTGVSSVSGTTNRITASPTTGAVIVDISESYVGQSSITTLGTITTWVWNWTAIANANLANSSISFATGSSGSDLNWTSSPVSLGGTATVNIPSMAATSVTRGLLTNTTQTLPGDKTFNSGTLTVTKTGGGDSKLVLQNSSFTGDFAFLTLGNSAVSRVGVRSESTDKATYLYAMPNGTGVLSGLNSTFSLFTTDFVADSTNISFMQMQAGVGLMGINMRNAGTGASENFNFLFNSTVTATLTTAGLFGVGTGTGTSAPDYRLTLVGTNATTPQINLRSSRSAIVATNVIGGIIFTSNDTTLTAPGTEVASFQALATATHTGSVLTTDFVWKGTNTLAYTETMRLTGEGLLGIGVAPTKGWLEIRAGTTTRSAITLTAGTNKTSSVAGDLEYDGTQIYFTNGGAVRQTIQQVQMARVASAFARTSSTTLTNITGLSVTLVAGKTYRIYAVIPTTSAIVGGVKFAIGGTCTATTINYTGTTQDAGGGTTYMSKSAALGGTVGESSNVTSAETIIRGEIIVNAGGTLTVQFGQNASNASSSTCTVGGQFVVTQIA